MPPPEDHAIEPEDSVKEKESAAVIPLYQEDTDYGGTRSYGVWKSPFDEEAERIERLIRSAEAEVDRDEDPGRDGTQRRPLYYTAEGADQSFEHIPFYEETRTPSAPVTYRRTTKRKNWFGMTSAVMGAVLTGIVLGMFVLSIFRGDTGES